MVSEQDPGQPTGKRKRWPWLVSGAVVALIAATAVVSGISHHDITTTAGTSTTAPTSAPTSAPAPRTSYSPKPTTTPVEQTVGSNPVNERQFIMMIEGAGVPYVHQNGPVLINLGYAMCTAYDKGYGIDELVHLSSSNDTASLGGTSAVVEIATAAAFALCPQHQGVVASYTGK